MREALAIFSSYDTIGPVVWILLPSTTSVQTAINGQVAALERMYVQAEERLVRPKVKYIDVYGKSLASRPTPVKERIDP